MRSSAKTQYDFATIVVVCEYSYHTNVAEESQMAEEEQSIKADQLEAVAGQLGDDWRKLATELSFAEDDIEYFGSEGDSKAQAIKMLTVWKVHKVS